MRGGIPIAVAALVAAAALAAPASAGDTDTILVDDDFYDPEKYSGSIGTDVRWLSDSGALLAHNVRASGKLFNSGPLTTDTDYTISPSAGTFAYYCLEHGTRGGGGMAGKLKIPPRQAATKRGVDVIGVAWAEGSNNTGDRFDVRYKGPGTDGKYKSWLKNTDEEEGIFGEGDDPANVRPDKNYSFRVRSEDSSDPSKRNSDWSPTLKVTAGTR
jgi:plastocyanin